MPQASALPSVDAAAGNDFVMIVQNGVPTLIEKSELLAEVLARLNALEAGTGQQATYLTMPNGDRLTMPNGAYLTL